MKILIAPDKFRDALSAIKVANAIEEGIVLASDQLSYCKAPLSDGGEGMLDILQFRGIGQRIEVEVHDPLMRLIKTSYLYTETEKTAYIEHAAASGLHLLERKERNCMYTSSFGTGELILNAIKNGAQQIVLGLGGSAVNDAGMGMAKALGYRFLNKNGNELEPMGKNLILIQKIDDISKINIPPTVKFTIAADVQNPLFGNEGAAYQYAGQKGANKQEIKLLDKGLQNFHSVSEKKFGLKVNNIRGTGASGGLGAAGVFFLKAKITSGIETIMKLVDFEPLVQNSDLIVTAEGKIDNQTLQGKLIHGICQIAKKYDKKVIALCGTLKASPLVLKEIGLSYATSILQEPMNLEKSMANTKGQIITTTENIFRFMKEFKLIEC
ncbi:glycerate kinase [Xanthovirga aplysinae]|uniref:glycerate kinase n=1 Tax=Xanthovirga aplysinae TaxID=2529853 RepID=UPI0012BD03A9|nr:glycerate kinase [Xanthovirga aplysinae]MTI32015.1 glycerate kinase [Xanthovirga aplysinae]